MYYKIIELCPRAEAPEYDEIKDLICHFLYALECNGQILKHYKIIKNENYLLYVTSPKEDSLDEKNDGIYVRSDREELLKTFSFRIENQGVDLESRSYCECRDRIALEMQTYTWDIDSVFTCCDCGKPIALYELPYPAKNQKDYCWVQNWQENYSSMDILWMNCLCDRYTGNQRVKIDSALNKQGIEIAQYMSEQLGYPVYYHLECDYGKSAKAEQVGDRQIHICPKCKRLMTRVRFTEDYERDVCEACKLSYDSH